MTDIQIERSEVNIDALNAALKTALGEVCSGVSSGPYGVMVHLDENATPGQIQQAQQIVRDHDASQKTLQQQVREQRRQRLEQARLNNTDVLDEADFSGQPALIRALVRKLVLLELEIKELRGE